MDSYKINFKRSAEKDLRQISNLFLRQLIQKTKSLAINPRPAGVQMLKGENRYFRIRHGDYRIIYEIQEIEKIVHIIKIGHRRDIYD